MLARNWRENPLFWAPNRSFWRAQAPTNFNKISRLGLAWSLAKVGVEGSNPFARSSFP
jgi:hypothetical protein